MYGCFTSCAFIALLEWATLWLFAPIVVILGGIVLELAEIIEPGWLKRWGLWLWNLRVPWLAKPRKPYGPLGEKIDDWLRGRVVSALVVIAFFAFVFGFYYWALEIHKPAPPSAAVLKWEMSREKAEKR